MTWNASYRLQLLFNPLTPESDNCAGDDTMWKATIS